MRHNLASTLLLSALAFSAAAYARPAAASSSDLVSKPTAMLTPPQRLNSLNIYSDNTVAGYSSSYVPVEVSFTVDTDGKPHNVQVVKGVDPSWNARIADAVLNLRYRPAVLDGKMVPMNVHLNIDLNK